MAGSPRVVDEMDPQIEQRRSFRQSQSREKLNLASIMLSKGDYNKSVIDAYLSLFYSVRILLVNNDTDTDDDKKILELIEKYYKPSGWTEIDIPSLLRTGRDLKERIEISGVGVTREDAERFYHSAAAVYESITREMPACAGH
jgi:uncharacterized protein (UPF0332 family)